jgi:hypothetical protein
MFDLNRAVDDWCRRAGSAAAADELRDHLWCAVDRLRAQGHDDREAFSMATAELGDIDGLAAELAKASGCGSPPALRAPEGSEAMAAIKLAGATLVLSAIWMAVILAVKATLGDTAEWPHVHAYLMAGWFACWLVPMALFDHRAAWRAECAFYRRVIQRVRS